MFVVGVDGRSSNSVRLVLTVQGQDRVPRLLEGSRLCRGAKSTQIRAQLDRWSKFYQVDPEYVVCSRSDALPAQWLDALGSMCPMEWVEEARLGSLLEVWQGMIPGPLWIRGILMALVFSLPAPSGGRNDDPDAWMQAWLSSQLQDVLPYCDPTEIPF